MTRPTVRLGSWTPPTQYNQPQLEPSGGIRTKEHEVLGDVSVIQELGKNAETFRLRGDAFQSDISELRELRGDVVAIRHSVYSGDVLIKSVSATSTSSWENEDGERRWVYNYNVQLVSV